MPKWVNYKGRICFKCGNSETYMKPKGGPVWYKYYDIKGNWDGKSYLCHWCNQKDGIIPDIQIKKHMRSVGRKCCICGSSETYIDNRGCPVWLREIDKNRNWTGGWMCNKCDKKDYYYNVLKLDPNSQANVMKYIANWRNNQLSIYGSNGKGIIGEAIIAKVRKLDILAIEMNNFNYIFDLSYDSEYGVPQVKIRSLGPMKEWRFNDFNYESFDTLFSICMNEEWKDVSRMYAIPKKIIIKKSSICIYKDPSMGDLYADFKIDEKPYNDAYHSLMLYLKDKKFFGIKDIKEWLYREGV